jgi:hypothetical protein
MDPETLTKVKLVLVVVGVPAAVLTLREANRLQALGAKIFPLGWAIAAFMTIGFSTPIFLVFRSRRWLPQTVEREAAKKARGTGDADGTAA